MTIMRCFKADNPAVIKILDWSSSINVTDGLVMPLVQRRRQIVLVVHSQCNSIYMCFV